MKTKYQYVGNISIPVIRDPNGGSLLVFFLRKKPKNKDAVKSGRKKSPGKRKIIGQGFWVPPGGGTKKRDTSQKHAAQRELREESRMHQPLARFRKVGTLSSIVATTGEPLWLVHLYVVFVDFARKDEAGIGEPEKFTDARWFNAHSLPRRLMPQDKKWLSRILAGEKLSVRVPFKSESLTSTLPLEIRSLGFHARWF